MRPRIEDYGGLQRSTPLLAGVFLVAGLPEDAADRLLSSLRKAGHTAVAVANTDDARQCVQRYPVDHMLVSDGCLSDAWPEIRLLKTEGSFAQIHVLCQTAGHKERQLAQDCRSHRNRT